MIKDLMDKFKIKHLLSTPYHPQTNGLVERFNRTLCESLAKTAQDLDNWDLQIAPTLFAYRTSKHSVTKISLFILYMGEMQHYPWTILMIQMSHYPNIYKIWLINYHKLEKLQEIVLQ